MPIYRQDSAGTETWTPDNSKIGRATAGTKNVPVYTLPAHNRKWTDAELKQYLILKARHGVLTPVLSLMTQRIPERSLTAVTFTVEPKHKVTVGTERQVTIDELRRTQKQSNWEVIEN